MGEEEVNCLITDAMFMKRIVIYIYMRKKLEISSSVMIQHVRSK